MKLIDADAIQYTENENGELVATKEQIDAVPRVTTEMVLKAHWETTEDGRTICSECGTEGKSSDTSCKACGVTMTKDTEQGD